MSGIERGVEIAAEHTRDRETEVAHGGEGRPECEAEAYADTIGRMHDAYRFDGMVILLGYNYSGLELTVTPLYFDENFGHRSDIQTDPLPALSSIRRYVMHAGVKISCIEKANFAVVA
jgi:hypothetical protein